MEFRQEGCGRSIRRGPPQPSGENFAADLLQVQQRAIADVIYDCSGVPQRPVRPRSALGLWRWSLRAMGALGHELVEFGLVLGVAQTI
jgi:hypothetical protein